MMGGRRGLSRGLATVAMASVLTVAAPHGNALEDLAWTQGQKREMNRLAGHARKHSKWWHVQTDYWEVRSDTSLRLATEIAYLLQWFGDSVEASGLLPEVIDRERPSAMILRHRADYEQRAARDGQGGHASWRWRGDELTEIGFYMALRDPRDLSLGSLDLETLRHEAMHCLIQKRLGGVSVPSWFHEGYAQWFESWDPRLDAAENRQRMSTSRGWARLFDALVADGKVPRLEAVLGLRTSHNTWATGAGVRTGLNYAASFSVIDTLVTDPQLVELKDALWERLRRDRSQLMDEREVGLLQARWLDRMESRKADQPAAEDR